VDDRVSEPTRLAEEARVARLRGLVKLHPKDHVPELAEGLVELSRALAEHRRYDEAVQAADEAVDLFEELTEGLPGAYRDSYGWAIFNLGRRLRDLGRVDDAHELYQEGIEIRRRDHRHDPYDRARFLGATLSEYSQQLLRDDRTEDALTAAREAVVLYRAARQEAPDAFTPELARALTCAASALRGLGRPGDAVDAMKRAVSLYRRVAAEDQSCEPDLAAALRALAQTQSWAGAHRAAVATAASAVEVGREIAATLPTTQQHQLALGLVRHVRVLLAGDQPEAALDPVTEAVDAWRAIAEADPNHRDLLAVTLALQANAAARTESADRGRASAAQAWALAREVVFDEGGDVMVLVETVQTAWPALDPAEAEVALHELIDVVGDPTTDNLRSAAGQAWLDLADLLQQAGRPDEGLAALDRCICLRREKYDHRPATNQRLLAATYRRLAERMTGLGRHEDAAAATADADAITAAVIEWPDDTGVVPPVPRPPIESALVERADHYLPDQ
jgi:tetratricopeptide (TPR) repeat protein